MRVYVCTYMSVYVYVCVCVFKYVTLQVCVGVHEGLNLMLSILLDCPPLYLLKQDS